LKKIRGARALPLLALLASFCAGVLVDWWLRTHGPPKPAQAPTEAVIAAPPAPQPTAARIGPAPAATPVATTGVDAPRTRRRVPIDGMDIESFKGGFAERRGSRPHDAVDMLSPRNTPVHAVEDGTIAKLFVSKAGGNTIYQFDPSGTLCYYYAHLERYADGLHDGQHVSQGDVIGFVGTSGNAPPNTPHLHFAVFELDADRKWWHGRALDPYQVFKNRG
jgi:murein DD-endopeptidase MepM/ murein hydrolase activator NlpD